MRRDPCGCAHFEDVVIRCEACLKRTGSAMDLKPDPRDAALELAIEALTGCKRFVSDERLVQIDEALAALEAVLG